jgi:hypothetical protein
MRASCDRLPPGRWANPDDLDGETLTELGIVEGSSGAVERDDQIGAREDSRFVFDVEARCSSAVFFNRIEGEESRGVSFLEPLDGASEDRSDAVSVLKTFPIASHDKPPGIERWGNGVGLDGSFELTPGEGVPNDVSLSS